MNIDKTIEFMKKHKEEFCSASDYTDDYGNFISCCSTCDECEFDVAIAALEKLKNDWKYVKKDGVPDEGYLVILQVSKPAKHLFLYDLARYSSSNGMFWGQTYCYSKEDVLKWKKV